MAIVCGTDLSASSRAGAAAAAALAARLGMPLCLVHATGDAEHILDPAGMAALRSGIALRLEQEAVRLADASGIAVETAIVEGHAANSLLEFARRRGASLLVVASQGHGASPLLRVGGTSERVSLESEIPIVVVRDAGPFERWMRGERPLRIVVGVDFTSSAASAWRWTGLLREAGPCDVVAAHLYYAEEASTRYGPRVSATATAGRDDMESLLTRDVMAWLGELPGEGTLTPRVQVAVGRLADHLVEVAEEERADLVVVGTHHRHHVSRLWSVSGGVLHLSRTAVATVPAAPRAAHPVRAAEVTKVLVATDLDEGAAGAVALAYGVLRCRAGVVHLLHIAPPAHAGSPTDAALEEQLRALAPVDAERDGVTTTVEIAHGPVAKTISETAERLGADLICVASRRRGRVAAAGASVASELLRRTMRPVLVVRPHAP